MSNWADPSFLASTGSGTALLDRPDPPPDPTPFVLNPAALAPVPVRSAPVHRGGFASSVSALVAVTVLAVLAYVDTRCYGLLRLTRALAAGSAAAPTGEDRVTLEVLLVANGAGAAALLLALAVRSLARR